MNTSDQPKRISIKDAINEIERLRNSSVISYIGTQGALIVPEDAGLIVDAIEGILPESGKINRLDLFLHSPGGFLDSAYKIIRICKEYTDDFNVIVPLAAKSAATAICLGAKEIIMTSFAELGPLDPIVQHPYKPEMRVPARSIKDFFAFLGNTQTDNVPVEASFKTQMASMLDPYLIGTYQTALQSSKQIAELLLGETNLANNPAKLKDTVNKLTEYYYSHAFVIDRKAAREMGLNVINAESNKELGAAIRVLNNVYQQFMSGNNIVKLIGNRELNRSVLSPTSPPSSSESTGSSTLKL